MFSTQVNNGGLLTWYNGYPVYEEYPTDPPSLTLNGLIYTSFGLYDYFKTKPDADIENMWHDTIRTITYLLPLYDSELISSYDLSHVTARVCPKAINYKYHLIHILLLQKLNTITKNNTIDYYLVKWAKMCGINLIP